MSENLLFISVAWKASTLRKSLKAHCLGHRVLQELQCKFFDPCSKLLRACWSFRNMTLFILFIFGSSSIQNFGNRGEEWLSFMAKGVPSLNFTFIFGWSFGFWDEKTLQDLKGWNGKNTHWYQQCFLKSWFVFFLLILHFNLWASLAPANTCWNIKDSETTICQLQNSYKTVAGLFFTLSLDKVSHVHPETFEQYKSNKRMKANLEH